MTSDHGGGNLTYTFYEIAKVNEIPQGKRFFIEIDGAPIVVFNITGQYYAIGDVCTHDNGPLGDGALEGYEIICPRHGAHFDVRNGKAVRLPAVQSTSCYPVRVVGDIIELGLPNRE
jgi:3-phenylpropionate/trans-cinnamate dioxygenase ferredoxin component